MKSLLKAVVLSASLLGATAATAQDTIRFAVTDIDGMEALQTIFLSASSDCILRGHDS